MMAPDEEEARGAAASRFQAHLEARAAWRTRQRSAIVAPDGTLPGPRYRAQIRLGSAAYDDDVDRARLELDGGADVNRVCPYGGSPLSIAVDQGSVNVARLLLDRGADLNERDRNRGGSLLHVAVHAARDRVAITRLLVDRGLNVRQTDDDGEAPLHVAAARGGADVASFLLDRGAEINKPGHSNSTPLIRAVACGNADVTRLLLRRGADIDWGRPGEQISALADARRMHARGEAPADSAYAHVLHFEAARAEVTRKLHADIWLRVMPFTM